MATTDRVREILSWYNGQPAGVLANLHRLMNFGRLAGTGKMVILPVDQGFEHGPARSFAKNAEGYDPRYHFRLAIESGCAAHAAPLGALETGAYEYAGEVPLILKLNNSDVMFKGENPISALTGSVKDALRIGATAIGFTIYPGSSERKEQYQEIKELIAEARDAGLPTVLWAYPRGSTMSKEGETAVDVVAYAAHVSCQLGAHIVKVKPPTAHLELKEAKKVYEEQKIPIGTLAERTRHVVQSCFNGRRIVIFSGGETKDDAAVMNDVKELAKGGAFGSIMGRNAFQRQHNDAVKLLVNVMDTFKNA
ncbi:MAG: class I fructose-bisphosphate aldolase [Myxococcota bacterium]|nr:class I fructose-bisphosphate aldolase [Myxococcota bacterium]